MKNKKFTFMLVIVVLFMSLFNARICDAASTPVFSLVSDSQSANVGDKYTIKIHVENSQDIYGFEAVISYDPDKAEFIKAESSAVFEGYSVTPKIENGKICIPFTLVGKVTPISGNTNVYNMKFKAIGTGDAKVVFNSIKVVDSKQIAKEYTANSTVSVEHKTTTITDTAPTWAEGSNLTASNVSSTGTTLTWSSAQDDTLVTGYWIYKGLDKIATVLGSANNYNVTGLSSSTTYTFTIQAVDGANNRSSDGPSTTVTTSSVGGGTVTQPVTNTIPGKVQIAAPVVDTIKGTATVTVDAGALNKALTESKVALVEIPKTSGVDSYVISLPASTLASDDATKVIKVVTEVGTVVVPLNMLTTSEVAGAAKVELTIEKADTSNLDAATRVTVGNNPVIELNLKVDGTTKPWSNPDAPVKVTIPFTPTAVELANPEHITVWNIDGEGKAVAMPSARYDAVTGTVTFTTTQFNSYAVVYIEKTFSDIGKHEWAKNAIEVMASKGVIGGTSETTYSPSKSITRADFLVLLVKALGLNTKTDANFDDVAEGSYYYNAVAIAKKLGITTGVGDNKFDPKANISRQDMIVLAEKAMNIAGKDLNRGSATDIAGYNDATQVSSYAQDAIASFVKEGIIAGSGNKLNPKQTATRAETAVIIYKLYNK